MKSILRYFLFIAGYFISMQLLLILLQYFLKDFNLSFFLSNLLISLATLLFIRRLDWYKSITIKKLSINKVLLYGGLAFIYGASFHLYHKNSIGFNFNKNIFVALSTILIAPIIEEVLFRCVAIEYLIKHGVKKYIRIIFTTIVFSLLHLPFYSIFDYHIFLFGFILALIYEKERNVIYGILFHAIVNFCLLFLK